MEALPRVSIVITVKDEVERVKVLVESLKRLEYPDFEVIFVDGGSSDGTYEFLKSMEGFKVLRAEGSTPAGGRNAGLEVAEGEVIAFTDGDCVVRRDWLLMAVRSLIEGREQGIGGVGGPIFPYRGLSRLSRCILNALSIPVISGGSRTFSQEEVRRLVDAIPMSNAIFWRGVLEEIGGFSPDLRYCEDADLCYRVRAAGYKLLYDPRVSMEHNWKVKGVMDLWKYMIRYGRGRADAIRKRRYLFSVINVLPSLVLIGFPILFALGVMLGGIFLWLPAAFLSLYLVLLVAGGIYGYLKFRDALMFVITPVVGVITHMGYGLGFLYGLIRGKW